jgi:uncharacterized membrane protein
MHRRHKHDIIVILSLIGFAVSVYLATAHYLGFTPPCTVTKGCEEVLASRYAIILGLPLSVWGIVFFTGTIVASLLANHYAVWKKLLTALLSIGALLSVVFLCLQFFVLRKVCQYCLVSDILVIILLILDLNIEHRKEI